MIMVWISVVSSEGGEKYSDSEYILKISITLPDRSDVGYERKTHNNIKDDTEAFGEGTGTMSLLLAEVKNIVGGVGF